MTDQTDYKYVKGISTNEQLGEVLSIEFSPLKVCSYDCVYCAVGRTTRKIIEREEFHPVADVFGEVRDYLAGRDLPDYALLTGSGESTLYTGFGRLAELFKETFPEIKLMIYTNASLFHHEDVRREVSLCDLVMVNLNSAEELSFLRICRPHKGIVLAEVIDGIRQFKMQYAGTLWMDLILVKGLNDSDEVLDGLMETVKEIGPERYVVRTLRPEAKVAVEAVTSDFKEVLEKKWHDLPFEIEYTL